MVRKPRPDWSLVLLLLREMCRVRYRRPELEALRRQTVEYCVREIVRQQREKWGLNDDED